MLRVTFLDSSLPYFLDLPKFLVESASLLVLFPCLFIAELFFVELLAVLFENAPKSEVNFSTFFSSYSISSSAFWDFLATF
jgi:hypothetical protein